MRLRWGIVLLCGAAIGQTPEETTPQPIPPDVETRAAWIERLRDEKQRRLTPQQLSAVERAFNKFADAQFLAKLEGATGGFRPTFGGLQTGSGFALGVAWRPPIVVRKPYAIRAEAALSTRLWQKYEAGISFPTIWNDRVEVDLFGGYKDLNSLAYYGPGPGSQRNDRSNFRMEESGYRGLVSLKLVPHVRVGAFGGYLYYNVGPGKDTRYISTEQKFTANQVPGLNQQTDYVRSGFELQLDWRDFPRGPKRGTNVLARWEWLSGRQFDLYSFRRLDVEATQYVPFFNEKRVFAFRAKTIMTFTNNGNIVPFYVQPTLGGSDDLRGFRPYRFYANNLAVANAEYRWEVFSGLDMALFLDAGQAFDRRADFGFGKVEGSWGFGFRGNVRNIPIIRLDVGFSREGFQIWFKFNNFM